MDSWHARAKQPLAVDVINPHHGDYYTGGNAPADTNEPKPKHRLSIRPETRFYVVVEGVAADVDTKPWVNFAVEKLLLPALGSLCFGAWTSAGYGRFKSVGQGKSKR